MDSQLDNYVILKMQKIKTNVAKKQRNKQTSLKTAELKGSGRTGRLCWEFFCLFLCLFCCLFVVLFA